MKSSRVTFLLIALALLLYAGCASRPTELIQQTEQARQEAKDAYASQFAMEDWSAGEKAWGQAEDALQKEDYGQATTDLYRAKSRYTKAREIAQGQKEATLRKIDGAKNAAAIRLKTVLENAAKLSASKRKEIEASAQTLQGDLAKIDEQLKNGEFSDADLLSQRTLRSVWELEQQMKK
jgi:hypothetical protein